jgi:tetratricopeptide (TPR) repeat protein
MPIIIISIIAVAAIIIVVYKVRNRPQPDSAAKYFKRGLAYSYKWKWDKAISDFDQAIKLDPNYIQAYNERGLAHCCKGLFDRAMKDCDQALQLSSNETGAHGAPITDNIEVHDQVPPLASKDAKEYFSCGLSNAQEGLYYRAIIEYSQAIQLNQIFCEAYLKRGIAFQQISHPGQAVNDYNKVIQLDRNNAQAYFNRGIANAGWGYVEETLKDYNQAIRLAPNEAAYYYRRGGVYLAKATDWRQTGNLAEPGDSLHKKFIDQAINDTDIAIQIDPNFSLAYHNRGVAYMEKSLVAKPRVCGVRIGPQHFNIEILNRAIQDFDQAILLDPTFGAPHLLKGEALTWKGDSEGAQQSFQRAKLLGSTK